MNTHLKIAWMYPDLMSTYGDRGNVQIVQKRAEWYGFTTQIVPISVHSPAEELSSCNIIFMGGAQDLQQAIVTKDLGESKGNVLKNMIEAGVPGLFICGGYQFLGNYYKAAVGTIIDGLKIFDLYTEHPGDQKKRCIGNIYVQVNHERLKKYCHDNPIIGFENHGGRTYLSDPSYAWGKVVKGYGNNGEDQTEGILYKNALGTYLHGPLLSKNPEIADFLIDQAVQSISFFSENILEKMAKDTLLLKI